MYKTSRTEIKKCALEINKISKFACSVDKYSRCAAFQANRNEYKVKL